MLTSASEALKIINQFGDDVVSAAQRELGAVKTRKSYRAKWQNGKLKSFTVKKRRSRADSTGALRKSLEYDVRETKDGFRIEFKGLDYGLYVESGRLPGKGIPKSALDRWIKAKPIRPRAEGGGFAKKTASALNSLAFLINRKIKFFGIEANPFMQPSIERFKPVLLTDLEKGYAKDIADEIRENYGN